VSDDDNRKDNDLIWEAFLEYDYERDGHISVNDLKTALEHAGEKISDDMCYLMISKADPENKGFI